MNKFEGINNLSPSIQTAAKTIYTAFEILKGEGGELPGKDVIERIPKIIELNDWETSRYEKSGYIRWQSILHFYTIDCSKAGYLRKQNGIWYLTVEGEKAMELGAVDLLASASKKYRSWDKERKKDTEPDIEEIIEHGDATEKFLKANLEQLEEKAIEGIKQYIINFNLNSDGINLTVA